jgi:hypothetical protein
MVTDWHKAFERGEAAVMIARRNAEVHRLNAMAREVAANRERGQGGNRGGKRALCSR